MPLFDLNNPAIPSPTGVAELDSPPNGNNIAIPVIILCAVLSAISYLVRIYAKFATKKFNSADYVTVVAFPLYWVYMYYNCRITWSPGYLVDMWNVRPKDIITFSYVAWVTTLLYLMMIALVRCAILLEWLNIFVPRGQSTYFTYVSYATCGAITALSLVMFIGSMTSCTPFEANWNALLPGAFCRWSVPKAIFATAVANSVLDVVPLVLAQKVIWGLHLSWTKKLGVSLIFLVGLLGLACSLVRLYFAARFMSSNNTTYSLSIVGLMSLCETTCANIILCVPSMPKFMKDVQETRASKAVQSYCRSWKSQSGSTNRSKGLELLVLPRIERTKLERLHSRSMERVTVNSHEIAQHQLLEI